MKKIIALCAVVLGVSFINPTESLVSQTRQQGEKKDTKMKEPKIACTLTLEKHKVKVGEFLGGKVEIKNVSKEDLVINYIAAPFYHLHFVVIDSAGKKVWDRAYRRIYSLNNEGQLILRPGETYASTVGIFAKSDASWQTPGTYKITVIYEYNNERAVSKEIELTLTRK